MKEITSVFEATHAYRYNGHLARSMTEQISGAGRGKGVTEFKNMDQITVPFCN
jgi:hypothetical protein